jgi:hypothetical protein
MSVLLQRSIFKPLVSCGLSKPVSILATFFASGMLHEYILAMVSLRAGNNRRPTHGTMFEPRYLLQSTFFLWNAILLIAENAAGNQKATTISNTTKRLPRPVKTILVLLSAVPFAHWFMDEYIRADIYADFAVGNFRIVKL